MKKNKAIIVFLVKFFATYFILFGAYSFYLNKTQQKSDVFVCSPITGTVANHVYKVSQMLGYDAEIEQHTKIANVAGAARRDFYVGLGYGLQGMLQSQLQSPSLTQNHLRQP